VEEWDDFGVVVRYDVLGKRVEGRRVRVLCVDDGGDVGVYVVEIGIDVGAVDVFEYVGVQVD